MKTLRLTDNARQDLVEWWAYLARENSPAVADEQLDRVFVAFGTLCEFSDAGRLRPELREGVRSYPMPPRVLLYSQDDTHVSILHAVHGSRDLPGIFDPQPDSGKA